MFVPTFSVGLAVYNYEYNSCGRCRTGEKYSRNENLCLSCNTRRVYFCILNSKQLQNICLDYCKSHNISGPFILASFTFMARVLT